MTKTVDIAHTRLRNMHPTLFKSLALMSAMLITGGIGMSMQGDYNPRQEQLVFAIFLPLQFWGLAFALAGTTILYGITGTLKRYKYSRYGLILGATICGIWAVSYIFGFLTGGTTSYLGAIFYIYLSGTMMIWAGEPAFNPLASALKQKGTNIAGSGTNE